MERAVDKLRKWEFEARIFISLGIAGFAYSGSYLFFPDSRPTFARLMIALGTPEESSLTIGYASCAAMMLFVSLLRMWAGSVLTPTRVMAFKVQTNALKTSGPYRFVRNPIYLADFVGMCMFALCLPPPGLLMPALFFMHYLRLIQFEEESLGTTLTDSYGKYFDVTPRLIPSPETLRHLGGSVKEFAITREGARHNALYVLFVPGFAVAAATHEFFHAVLIGLPAVLDWAIIHTKIGLRS